MGSFRSISKNQRYSYLIDHIQLYCAYVILISTTSEVYKIKNRHSIIMSLHTSSKLGFILSNFLVSTSLAQLLDGKPGKIRPGITILDISDILEPHDILNEFEE